MNRFHKDRPDPCSLCSINIRKQLISYKDRPVKIDSDHLAGFFIIFHSRLWAFSIKSPSTALAKGSTRGFWLLDTKQYRNPRVLQLFKQFLCPVICRCPVGKQWYYRYQRAALCILLCKASHNRSHTQNPDIHPEKMHLNSIPPQSFPIARKEEYTLLPEGHS